MKVMRIGLCVIVCFAFLGAVGAIALSEEVARVDDVVIQDADVMHMVSLLPRYWLQPKNKKKIDRERLLDRLIDEILLAREAKRLNLEQRADYKKRLESVQRELLAELRLKKLWEDKSSEANQRRYHQENRSQYTSDVRVRPAVIAVRSEEEAKDILEKIKNGKDFSELAKTYSVDRTAEKGGDMGFHNKATMASLGKTFSDTALSMKKGQVEGPVSARGAYYIIKLIDRRGGELIKFEEIKTKIASDYAKKLRSDEISRLREAARIHINSEVLENLEIR